MFLTLSAVNFMQNNYIQIEDGLMNKLMFAVVTIQTSMVG